MALSLNALVTEVQSRIRRTDINTNIQNVLLQQITWLETLEYWPWRTTRDQSSIVLASDTYAYDVPSDFGEDLAFIITEDDKEDYLDRLAFHQFISKYPDPSANNVGQPTAYTIGYAAGTASAGNKQIWFPHPADGSYANEFIYYNRRADCTATDFPTGFTELEKLILMFRASAHIKKSILGYDECTGQPNCRCDACEGNSWLAAAERRYSLERIREKPKWKMPKKKGYVTQYDVRGNQKIYNV